MVTGMTRLKRLFFGRNPRRTLIRAAALAAVSYAVFGHVLRPVRVQGISMAPTLVDGTIHLVNLAAYWRNEPQRGDMVAVEMPGRRAYYMKRVLGLPGEQVGFAEGQLLVNGEPMAEPYLAARGDWNMGTQPVPEGHYFIACDNRLTSFEGHTLGFVETRRIAGRLWR